MTLLDPPAGPLDPQADPLDQQEDPLDPQPDPLDQPSDPPAGLARPPGTERRLPKHLRSGAGGPGPAGRWSRWPVELLLFLGLLAAVRLVLLAYAMAAKSTGQAHFAVFWLGLLLGLGCVVALGLRSYADNGFTRSGLLLLYGVFTLLPKVLMSQSGPRYFDEYGQFRHVNDILRSGNLFAPLSYQPIVSDFPGLSLATIAVRALTGLSVWHSGQLVILIAHCTSLLIVCGIARTVGVTPRSAFLAAIVYSLNPSFIYFDTQFAYESLALPLALLAIWACLQVFNISAVDDSGLSMIQRRRHTFWMVVGFSAAASCVVTHHLSAMFMDITCILIALTFTVRQKRDPYQALRPGWSLTGFAVTATVLWLTLVAKSVGSYLGPHFEGAVTQILQVAGLKNNPASVPSGQGAKRTLFAGSDVPIYEKLLAFSTPFIALGLVLTAAYILRRASRVRPLAIAGLPPFAILSAAYFLSLPFSLTSDGSEISHRSWGYSYLGIAVVVGLGLDRWGPRKSRTILPRAAVGALLASSLAIGNTAVGVNVLYRFPGPYVFGTDTRSRSADLRRVVTWLNANATPDSGVVTDRFTSESIVADTRLRVPSPDQYLLVSLFVQPTYLPPLVRETLISGNFQYFILDKHILDTAPEIEFYPGAESFLPVNIPALKDLGNSTFLQPALVLDTYVIYRIDA